MDDFKRETEKGFTVWDINAKCVYPKHRHKDAAMVKRNARRKFKQSLAAKLEADLIEQDILDSLIQYDNKPKIPSEDLWLFT